MKIKSRNVLFLISGLLFFFNTDLRAQTILYQSGFETGDPAFTYSCGSCTGGLANGTTNPRTGTNAGFINGGSTKSYDGSIITGTAINFLAGKYYTVEVWSRVAVCTGSLDIRKSVTNTNAAMIAATGADILLDGTINVTGVTYSKYSSTFTVAANETKYVGFQLNSGGGGACGSLGQYIDDVVITQYDYPPCSAYCVQGGSAAGSRYISQVVFNGINRTSGFDGYACTGNSASVRRTLSYNLEVTAPTSASVYYSAAWIDWNADGDFLDAGEEVMAGNVAHPATIRTQSVTVPATAVLATTKMRVKIKFNAAITGPCEAVLTNDDVEDYDIIVQPAPVAMVYSSTTVTQLTGNVNAGSFKNEVLKVNVFTTGQLSAPAATQMVFTTLGTTNIADITNARIYFTGNSSTFSSTTQLGATIAVPPADPTAMTFTFSKTLSEGDNFFWIAYDVVATAPGGNVIDAKMVSTTVAGTTYAINSTPAGSRPIVASFPMSFVSASVVQNSNPLPVGSALNDVIQIQVNTTGAISPLTSTAFTFRTNGTTNTGDIQNARLFYTGDSPVFSTATQVGTTIAVPPAINIDFTITGTSTLVPGTNYFWLTYDVKPTAACNPAQIDALCNNVVIAGVNRIPSPSSPLGARVINCGTAYYSQCSCDMMNPANWNTARNGTGTALANVSALALATNSFYVQNGHSMTTSISDTISDLYLEPGSYVTASQLITISKLYIQSFATFEQTYAQTNATIGGSYVGSFYIKKDGTWKHNNAGSLPGTSGTQYFEPYSIQWFQGVGGNSFPGGTNWGTVILDVPTAPNLIINASSLSSIHGDFIIRRWGTSTNYFYINNDNPITVDGNLIMSGGWIKGVAGFNCNATGCTCNGSASGVAVSVAGDWIMSGGNWNDFACGSNTSTGMAMSVGGNVNISGGIVKMNTNLGSKLDLVPTLASSTWSQSGGTVTLGNTNVKAGKTVKLTGTKIGDSGAGTALVVEAGAKLMCSNYPATGAGNFTLQTGGWLGIGSAAGITASGASGNIQVSGTRSYNSGATYEYYEGLTPQATGNFTTTTTSGTYPASVANLIINKAASSNVVTLTGTTDVTTNLALTNGVLMTSFTPATAPWVRIPAAATVTPDGGSASSFVDGYIRRTGATAFNFPTGNGTKWRRMSITAPSISTEFEARYVGAPYSNTTTMALAPATVLDHVSKLEHWLLTKPLGADAATVKVKLYWESATTSGVLKFDSLSVARWSGSAWENANCYGACPANWTTSTAERTYTGGASGAVAGTVQSNTTSLFGPFTLSSVGVRILNPLPVSLLSFTAECADRGVDMEWVTATESNNDFYTIERSRNGRLFDYVADIKGAGNSSSIRYYAHTDSEFNQGIIYYRLSQTDFDGNSKQLQVIPVKCGDAESVVHAYNNNLGFLVLETTSDKTQFFQVQVFDALGKKVLDDSFSADSGRQKATFDITKFERGVYFVYVTNAVSSSVTKISVN